MNSTWWQWSTPGDLRVHAAAPWSLIASMIAEPGREDVLLARAVERQADGVQVDHRVEVAAERQASTAPSPNPGTSTVRRGGRTKLGTFSMVTDVGVAVADGDPGDDQPGRGVEPDRGDRLDDRDHAGLDQHGGDADGAVTAHRQAAGHLDVEHAPVAVGPGRRLQDRAAHRGVPARLVHQEQPQVVQVLHEVQPPLVHGGARDDADAAGDDARRHPLGVRVDGGDQLAERIVSSSRSPSAPSGRRCRERLAPCRARTLAARARRLSGPRGGRRRTAVPLAGDVHGELDRLHELGPRVPAEHGDQLPVQLARLGDPAGLTRS